MEYVIGGILLLIVLFIVGLIWRKKVYDEVDRLEGWKMDIMNRRVTDELSKVKSLNLSGETQEKFEAWRGRWDQILTKDLPGLEEDLFDAEDAADKYKLKRVKKVLAETENKLSSIEDTIESMYKELDNLLDSEKNSREEVEAIQPELKELSKRLIQNRYQYGKAVYLFEGRVEKLEQQVKEFAQLVDQGDYIEANTLVQKTKEELSTLKLEADTFPQLYKSARHTIPEQLKELKHGMKDMEEEGYRIAHLEFLPEVHKYEQLLTDAVKKLDLGEQTDVDELLSEVEARIQEMYQALEKEAIAHSYVEKHYGPLKDQLIELENVLEETQTEVKEIQATYQLEDQDLDDYRGLKTMLSQLKKRLASMDVQMEDEETSFSHLKENMELTKTQLEELRAKHENLNERVHALRKDEREAKKKLFNMEQLLMDTHRRLKRSNIPGIPADIYKRMKIASEKLDEVFQSLERQPLDMVSVNQKLEEAVQMTEELHAFAEQTMEKAERAERLIQYANRYRSQYPLVAAKLLEAESVFRSLDYDGALELASEALHDVDPKALSRIQDKENVLV
ncbi:septation ring formation regulator EzrA [Halobacillus fulvus]|nr:septation ring formation regulator EzrA [Halobacillus fulvus]